MPPAASQDTGAAPTSRGRRILAALTEPSAAVTSSSDRRRARLSSVLCLLMLVVAVPYLFLTFATPAFGGPAPLFTTTGLIDVAAVGVIVIAYALSRTRHNQAGMLLAATLVNLSVWALWAVPGTGTVPDTLFFLAMGFILASGVLPFRASMWFAVVNLAIFVVVIAVAPQVQAAPLADYVYLGFFLFVCAVLLEAGGFLYQRDQERLEERTHALAMSESRFRSMAENLPQAVFIADVASSKVLYASPGFERIYGRPREDLYQNPNLWLEAIRPDHRTDIAADMARNPGSAANREFVVVQPDGQERIVRNVTFPIADATGRTELLAGISEDVTVYHEAQRILQESNERLKDTERFRLNMINTMAHDLNSPLSPIKIQVKLLRGADGETAESRENALAIIDRNTDHITRLVRDLHDLAKLESGNLKLRITPTDLKQVVEAATGSFQAVAAARSVRLDGAATGPLRAPVDSQRVTQVLYNLVSNAIKFTPPGGTVRVRAQPDDQGVLVSVSDTGRGLEAHEISKLFQPFSQVHDPSETTERGSGLGLYICKGIMSGHKGRIWVESQGRGHGSTFKAWFPESPQDLAAPASAGLS